MSNENIIKNKERFLKKYFGENLCPAGNSFLSLTSVEFLQTAIYLTINFNFRKKPDCVPSEIVDIICTLSKYGQDYLRKQPKKDIHCSLLNIMTYQCLHKKWNKRIIKRGQKMGIRKIKTIFNAKNELKDELKNLSRNEYEYQFDYLFFSKEGIALQIFPDKKLIDDLKDIQKKIHKIKLSIERKAKNNIEWKNELKLYPKNEEPGWGAMNLMRFKKMRLPIDLSKYLANEICKYNVKARNNYLNGNSSSKITTRLNLVYSDQLFSKGKSGVLI